MAENVSHNSSFYEDDQLGGFESEFIDFMQTDSQEFKSFKNNHSKMLSQITKNGPPGLQNSSNSFKFQSALGNTGSIGGSSSNQLRRLEGEHLSSKFIKSNPKKIDDVEEISASVLTPEDENMIDSSEDYSEPEHDQPRSMGVSQRSESQNVDTQNSLPQNALVFIQQANVFTEPSRKPPQDDLITFAHASVDSSKRQIISQIDIIEEENAYQNLRPPLLKKDPIVKNLSSKILFLHTMFRSIDMIHFHHMKQQRLLHAFNRMRQNAFKSHQTSHVGIQTRIPMTSVKVGNHVKNQDQSTQIETHNKSRQIQTQMNEQRDQATDIMVRSRNHAVGSSISIFNKESIAQTEKIGSRESKSQTERQSLRESKSQTDKKNLRESKSQTDKLSMRESKSQTERSVLKESVSQTDPAELQQQHDHTNEIIDEFKSICDQLQEPSLKSQLKSAINKIYLYCDMLDEVKQANFLRIKQLDKIEIEQFERSVKFEQKQMEQSQSSLKISTANVQKMLSSNTQSCQTDISYVDLLQRELKVEQRSDQVNLKAFRLMEQSGEYSYKNIDERQQQFLNLIELVQKNYDLMVQDIQLEGFSVKKRKQLTLQELAAQHTKYYGIVGLVSADLGSPDKSHATSFLYNQFLNGKVVNLSPDLKNYLSLRGDNLSPQSPQKANSEISLQDRVLMTLGKDPEHVQPNFEKLNKMLKAKEQNLEKMKKSVVQQAQNLQNYGQILEFDKNENYQQSFDNLKNYNKQNMADNQNRKSTDSRSPAPKSVQKSFEIEPIGINSKRRQTDFNTFSPDRSFGRFEKKKNDELQKLKIAQKNLQIQKEYMENLRDQYLDQLKQLKEQKEDLKMIETDMNQQKLKMLIKFDKIKFLEDYYNSNQRDEENYIHLDIELDQDELFKLAENIFVNFSRKQQTIDNKKHWAIVGLSAIFDSLIKKRKQTQQNRLKYSFFKFRLQIMKQNLQQEVYRRKSNLKLAPEPVKTVEYFHKLRKNNDLELLQELSKSYQNGVQVKNICSNLIQDIGNFQKFKEKNILNLMFLHYRRRARLLKFFAFQKYKSQMLQMVISDITQKQNMGIIPRQGMLSSRIQDQVNIKQRQKSILLMNCLTKLKKQKYISKSKFFNQWKNFTEQQVLTQILDQNTVQKNEIISLKIAHNQTLSQFNQQKQDLELKLQKMAVLIQQKLS